MKVLWQWLRHGKLFEESDRWPVWPFALLWVSCLVAILWWALGALGGSG